MITSAWIMSGLCAFPQTLVFRVLKHPEVEFYQCTSMKYFDDFLNNGTMISPNQAEKIYNSLFLMVVYTVPLCVIIITYANILNKIFKKSRGDLRPVLVIPYSASIVLNILQTYCCHLLHVLFEEMGQYAFEMAFLLAFWGRPKLPALKIE